MLLATAGPILTAAAAGLLTAAAMPVLLLAAAAEVRGSISPHARVRRALAIPGCQHDLELVQLIPFGIGPLALRNGEQRLQARSGGRWLLFVHNGIISRRGARSPHLPPSAFCLLPLS
jgi:hypothetical protein